MLTRSIVLYKPKDQTKDFLCVLFAVNGHKVFFTTLLFLSPCYIVKNLLLHVQQLPQSVICVRKLRNNIRSFVFMIELPVAQLILQSYIQMLTMCGLLNILDSSGWECFTLQISQQVARYYERALIPSKRIEISERWSKMVR